MTMTKTQQQAMNHPKKGSRITVDPIKNLEDIKAIKQLLADKPRDLLLFTMGINNGLRIGDLLQVKVGDVRHLKPGEYIMVREQKTGKENCLMVNKAVHKALRGYLDKAQPKDDDYLFASRQGSQKPLTPQRIHQMIKGWTKQINLPGNYGTHSLRKTFGYIQRTKYKVGFEVLAKRFNHSSPAVTMRYLGLSSDDVNGILMNDI